MPENNYLAVAHNTSPFVTIYSRSGDTFTKLPNPAALPTGIGYGVGFYPSSQFQPPVGGRQRSRLILTPW